ncbi:beta-1,3-glucan-binding protein [Phlyctochytrium arcticum]|nr:beta-1,3-glucan-binding protein [Phlyctochytrium arcticum]
MIVNLSTVSATLAVLSTAFLASGVSAAILPRQAASKTAAPAPGSTSAPSAKGCGQSSGNFCPVFEDNFDTFDLSKWKHDVTMSGGGNWEFQMYVNNRTNSYVKDGVLEIRPTFTSDVIGADKLLNGGVMDLNQNENGVHCTDPSSFGCMRSSDGTNIINPIQSARISTVDSASIRFGRVEVKAQLPVGDWLWPAIWMLPKNSAYGPWPASGEIDIMEARGNGPGQKGYDQSSSALHWGPYSSANQFEKTVGEKAASGGTYADAFHTFGVEWTPEKIVTYVDDPKNVILEVKNQNWWEQSKLGTSAANPWETATCSSAPFDQEFYLVINLAVGGTSGFFKDGPDRPWAKDSKSAAKDFWTAKDSGWGKTWTKEKSVLKIDSVKMWKMC